MMRFDDEMQVNSILIIQLCVHTLNRIKYEGKKN